MRPTLSDLAQAAGVSTATVDRVLNGRAGVALRTQDIVFQTAQRIGYLPDTGTATQAITLTALLPGGTNRFIEELRAHLIATAKEMPGVTLSLPEMNGLDAGSMADALSKVGDAQGVAVVALNHPRVHDALERLTAQGVHVVTLLSDLPDTRRLAYVGIDNLRAGRLAGEIMTRFLGPRPKGKVALFAGSLNYRGHQEREIGLRQYLAEESPGLSLLELRESNDDRDRAYAQMRDKLAQHPELCAIYNAGGGTSGIARALQDTGRADEVVFVAHEATDNNKALLLEGTLDAIIDQNAKRVAYETLWTLNATIRGQDRAATQPRVHLILKENIPADGPPLLQPPET